MTIGRTQMNRQLYNMGSGEEMMQENVQEGIMQVAPEGAQQAQAEQYRPVAEDLAQDPKKALALLIKMLIEQGVPPEQAEKIAMEMIQGVAEGGMEEVSEDTRVEARFGGRMEYASGGIGRLVDREQYGLGSFFKKVTSIPRKLAKGVKSVAKSPLGRMALTVAAGYYLGPAGLNIGSGMGAIGGGALRAALGNLAVQAVSGQKINFKEALTAAAVGGVVGGVQEANTLNTGPTDSSGQFGGQENLTINEDTYGGGYSQSGTNIVPPAKPGFLGQELTQTPTGNFNSLSNADGMVMGVDEFSPSLTARQELARTNFGSNSGNAMASTQDLTKLINQPGYDTYLPEDIGGAVDIGIPTQGYNVTNNMQLFDPNEPIGAAQSYNSQLGNYGQVTSGRPISISERFSGGIDDIKQGNYMDALKQVSGAALDNPIASTLGISTLAGMSAGQPPEQNPGESMEDYNRRVEIWKTTLDSNLGNTGSYSGYKLPSSANNPFYASGGRVSYQKGGRMGYAYGNSVEQGIMSAPQIADQMGMPVGNPRQNQQGIAELDYREEGGFVPPIGIKEKEDDIPAMLSNNEFVFTADAVKNAGGGDPNVGAQKMYSMMKQLENGGRV